MRITSLLFVFMIVGFFSSVVLADEFGDRFYNQTPLGLGEHTVVDEPDIAMDDKAEDLQNIQPAAGEEDTTPVTEDSNLEQ